MPHSSPLAEPLPPTPQFKPGTKCPVPIAYGIDDAVAVSGIGRTTLYALIGSGRLRSVKVGTRRLIRREDLLALLASEPRETGEEL